MSVPASARCWGGREECFQTLTKLSLCQARAAPCQSCTHLQRRLRCSAAALPPKQHPRADWPLCWCFPVHTGMNPCWRGCFLSPRTAFCRQTVCLFCPWSFEDDQWQHHPRCWCFLWAEVALWRWRGGFIPAQEIQVGMPRRSILVNLWRWQEEELISKLHNSWVFVGAKVTFSCGTSLCCWITSGLICSDVVNICVHWMSDTSLCWALCLLPWFNERLLSVFLRTSEDCNFLKSY